MRFHVILGGVDLPVIDVEAVSDARNGNPG